MLGPEWAPIGCPYIDRWFARHSGDPAPELERLVRRFSRVTNPSAAEDYIDPICSRLGNGIEHWRSGHDVSGELTDAGLSDQAALRVQAKAAPGQALSDPGSPVALAQSLGPGMPLDGATASRFSSAMGNDVSGVRVHDDARASGAARRMNALAFTVGRHIAFSRGAYQPNTIAGDALLAHELAHVEQQRGALDARSVGASSSTAHLERDADWAAAATVARLHGIDPSPWQGELETRPSLRSNLALQRCCDGGSSTAPTIPTPAPRRSQKDLAAGRMTWDLKPYGYASADIQISFQPNATVGGRTVTFVQTVLQSRNGRRTYAEDDAQSRRFEAGSDRRRVDQFLTEGAPFYGAHWGGSGWVAEESEADRDAGRRNAPSTATSPAYLYDEPRLNSTPESRHDESQVFETAAVVMETGQVLGSLRWGFANHRNAPYRELLGAQDADCTETASADFSAALEQFYVAKFETILDGFPSGSHTLTSDHQTKLASTVDKATTNTSLRIELGGAADLGESDAETVSRERATAVRSYLVTQGIAESRIDVIGYGASWARVATTPGASEARNRRVQVRLYQQPQPP
jgi:outer membrane protein OmpA-like peptidoglycan-associated protein